MIEVNESFKVCGEVIVKYVFDVLTNRKTRERASVEFGVTWSEWEWRQNAEDIKKYFVNTVRCFDLHGGYENVMNVKNNYVSLIKSLCSKVVHQVPLVNHEVKAIVSCVIDAYTEKRYFMSLNKVKGRQKDDRAWTSLIPPHNVLRVKNHIGAINKVNMTFYGIMRSLSTVDPKTCEIIRLYSGIVSTMYDDQGAALALYVCGAAATYGYDRAIRLGILGILHSDIAKELSTLLKAVGANCVLAGALACELNTLQGRGVNEIDVISLSLQRCQKSCIPDIGIDDDLLRKNIIDILTSEMGDCEFEQPDVFWHSRWLWCANGAHNNNLGVLDERLALKYKKRLYRKVAAESWGFDPTDGWDGRTLVTPSQKLEHGKSRLLLACDTVSYMAFEHFLEGVERSWRGKRVVLDPGSLTNSYIRDWVWGNGDDTHCIALDYDDFNAQHTLKAQKMVFEEAIKLSGYDSTRGKSLVDSFDKMFVKVANNIDSKRVVGTLLSGHRATTFLNSVLNAAYIKSAIGSMWYKTKSMHIGDDVLMLTNKQRHVDSILGSIRDTELKMNPAKQSIGQVSAELLRVAHGKHGNSYGYYARSVASCVSGSWVSNRVLSNKERLTSCITSAWTLMNRSGCNKIPAEAISYTVAKICEVDQLMTRRLCTGDVAVFGGPCRITTGGYIETVQIREKLETDYMKLWDENTVPDLATVDYIGYCLTWLERKLFDRCRGEVKRAMIASSYRKAECCSEKPSLTQAELYCKRYPAPTKCITSRSLEEKKRFGGIFMSHPVITLMRYDLKRDDVRQLAVDLGLRDYSSRYLWGEEPLPCIMDCVLPYSEAASICSRGGSYVVNSRCNIYV